MISNQLKTSTLPAFNKRKPQKKDLVSALKKKVKAPIPAKGKEYQDLKNQYRGAKFINIGKTIK